MDKGKMPRLMPKVPLCEAERGKVIKRGPPSCMFGGPCPGDQLQQKAGRLRAPPAAFFEK